MLWTGKQCYGRTDEVPGLFHVRTLFGHCWFFPIFPICSVVRVRRNRLGWTDITIRPSFKSWFLAWARAVMWIGSYVFGVLALVHWGIDHPQYIISTSMALSCMVTLLLLYRAPSLRLARYERATQLADWIELPDIERVLLELHFKHITEAEADELIRGLLMNQAQSSATPLPIKVRDGFSNHEPTGWEPLASLIPETEPVRDVSALPRRRDDRFA